MFLLGIAIGVGSVLFYQRFKEPLKIWKKHVAEDVEKAIKGED